MILAEPPQLIKPHIAEFTLAVGEGGEGRRGEERGGEGRGGE